MRVPTGLVGVLGASLVALLLTYGVWLLATADQGDGGREAMGRFVVGVAALVVVFTVAPFVIVRLRRRTPRRL